MATDVQETSYDNKKQRMLTLVDVDAIEKALRECDSVNSWGVLNIADYLRATYGKSIVYTLRSLLSQQRQRATREELE